MADTQQPQNGKQENAKQEPKQEAKNASGITRIPVTKIWVREQIDLPGILVQERLDCLPQTAPGRKFWVAKFLPAYQVIELDYYQNEKSEPHRLFIPMSFVKRFE